MTPPGQPPAVIRIIVADDEALVRDGLRAIAELEGDIEVIAEAATGEQAIALARQLRPDVVLMDVRMPGLDGIQATRRLLAEPDPPRVLVRGQRQAAAVLRRPRSVTARKDSRNAPRARNVGCLELLSAMLALSIRTLIRVGAAMDQVDLLAMCRVSGVVWHFLAREAQRPEGMERLRAGRAAEESPDATKSLAALAAASDDLGERQRTVEEMLEGTRADGIQLTTVLDEDYPVNLRTIYNLPPFLFYKGTLRPDDALSVAVVGTREASVDGLSQAERMARLLVDADVTVLSGLARGIDTIAHQACLDAGGRTIAVLGSGIRRVYPPENKDLATQITENGAIVSQFWPDAPPTSYTFPRRNVVTSGMSQGTVVIEASATSGAKMQARLAIEHGKQVFLPHSLVTEREWARKYLERPRVHEVNDVADIVRLLRPAAEQRNRAMERVQIPLTLF